MSETISVRLTPEREKLLKTAKRYYKVKNNSEVIDLALKEALKDRADYESRLKSVVGCVKLKGKENSIERIRKLRGH